MMVTTRMPVVKRLKRIKKGVMMRIVALGRVITRLRLQRLTGVSRVGTVTTWAFQSRRS